MRPRRPSTTLPTTTSSAARPMSRSSGSPSACCRCFTTRPVHRTYQKVFFGSGGSDADDTNFKLVRYYNNLRGKPEKKKIISRAGASHGLTYAAGQPHRHPRLS